MVNMSIISTNLCTSIIYFVLFLAPYVDSKQCFFTQKECPNYCCTPEGSKFDEYCCDDCSKSDEKNSLACRSGTSIGTIIAIGIVVFIVLFVLIPVVICCVCCGLFARLMGNSGSRRGGRRNAGVVHNSAGAGAGVQQVAMAANPSAAYPRQQAANYPAQAAAPGNPNYGTPYPAQAAAPVNANYAYGAPYGMPQPQPLYGVAPQANAAPPPAYDDAIANK